MLRTGITGEIYAGEFWTWSCTERDLFLDGVYWDQNSHLRYQRCWEFEWRPTSSPTASPSDFRPQDDLLPVSCHLSEIRIMPMVWKMSGTKESVQEEAWKWSVIGTKCNWVAVEGRAAGSRVTVRSLGRLEEAWRRGRWRIWKERDLARTLQAKNREKEEYKATEDEEALEGERVLENYLNELQVS